MYMLDQLIPAPPYTVAIFGPDGKDQQMARVHAFGLYRFDYFGEESTAGDPYLMPPKIVPITVNELTEGQVNELDGSYRYELPSVVVQDKRAWKSCGPIFRQAERRGRRWIGR